MTGRLLTAREVAGYVGYTPETILAYFRTGRIPGFRLPGGQIRFRAEAIDRWLEDGCPRVRESRLTVIEERSSRA